jgi:hypothetical protein
LLRAFGRMSRYSHTVEVLEASKKQAKEVPKRNKARKEISA